MSADAALSARSFPTRLRDGPSPFVEFMLVGGSTLALFPLAWVLRAAAGRDPSELAVGFFTFYAAYVVNDPHFAVTYLLFYKRARQRAFGAEFDLAQRVRYWVAGALVPAALATTAIVAIASGSAQTLGWMVQTMFLLVGWHYVKQGFGVLAVLSARRGVPLRAGERTVIVTHCFVAWAYAWANPAVAAGEFEEKGVVYRAFAHPRWFELVAGATLALSTVALVATLIVKWRRERRAFPLAPMSGFLITVWSWTIYSSADRLIQYMIPALHSVQYFYFVWLMKRNEAREGEGPPHFGRPSGVQVGFLAFSALALGWLLFRGLPTFLDDALVPHRRGSLPSDLGETPYFAAFFVFVNIHHYFMDHVIWRRENPDTRYLRSRDA